MNPQDPAMQNWSKHWQVSHWKQYGSAWYYVWFLFPLAGLGLFLYFWLSLHYNFLLALLLSLVVWMVITWVISALIWMIFKSKFTAQWKEDNKS